MLVQVVVLVVIVVTIVVVVIIILINVQWHNMLVGGENRKTV